jgi:tRNA nucleotidyltransferase (CCA-adding enzyme)
MGMVDLESKSMLSQRWSASKLPDALHKFTGDNYRLYTLLAPYDTETLLYLMAATGSEKSRRLISNYFTKMKGIEVQLRGRDLIGMGLKPGPLFKEIFERLLQARLENLVKTREDEIEFVREHFPPSNEAVD